MHNSLRGKIAHLPGAYVHDKILRIPRTTADLDASPTITTMHLNEAINYRMLDRSLWT